MFLRFCGIPLPMNTIKNKIKPVKRIGHFFCIRGGILLSLLFLTHCVSVRVELEPKYGQTTSFVHYNHYGLFGLMGKGSINIQSACITSKPVYVRNYFSFEDFLFTVTLLGLYTPKSTEIQCELPQPKGVSTP